MARDEREIASRNVQQFEEDVLNLDVVIRTGKAESSRTLEGIAACAIQLSYQGAQIRCHLVSVGSRPRATDPNYTPDVHFIMRKMAASFATAGIEFCFEKCRLSLE
jgi:hypothetical protein